MSKSGSPRTRKSKDLPPQTKLVARYVDHEDPTRFIEIDLPEFDFAKLREDLAGSAAGLAIIDRIEQRYKAARLKPTPTKPKGKP